MTFFFIVVMKLQRELYFDYDTNLGRVRCLPPSKQQSCASSENQANIPKYLQTHFNADFRNLKSLAKITSHEITLNWPDRKILYHSLKKRLAGSSCKLNFFNIFCLSNELHVQCMQKNEVHMLLVNS